MQSCCSCSNIVVPLTPCLTDNCLSVGLSMQPMRKFTRKGNTRPMSRDRAWGHKEIFNQANFSLGNIIERYFSFKNSFPHLKEDDRVLDIDLSPYCSRSRYEAYDAELHKIENTDEMVIWEVRQWRTDYHDSNNKGEEDKTLTGSMLSHLTNEMETLLDNLASLIQKALKWIPSSDRFLFCCITSRILF